MCATAAMVQSHDSIARVSSSRRCKPPKMANTVIPPQKWRGPWMLHGPSFSNGVLKNGRHFYLIVLYWSFLRCCVMIFDNSMIWAYTQVVNISRRDQLEMRIFLWRVRFACTCTEFALVWIHNLLGSVGEWRLVNWQLLLLVYLCVYWYINICACIHVHIYIYVRAHICIYVYIYICQYINIYTNVYVCV